MVAKFATLDTIQIQSAIVLNAHQDVLHALLLLLAQAALQDFNLVTHLHNHQELAFLAMELEQPH